MKPFLVTFCLLLHLNCFAQQYWQQQVHTRISVLLNDTDNRLLAHETLEYTNNSPDTLKVLYFHLWPNAYKHDHTPFAKQFELNGNTSFYYAKDKDRGYIDSLDFTVDGQSVDFFIADNLPDICRIDLVHPLFPGKKVKITTPFRVKLPEVFSRLGHNGQAYFVSQWFPKPAVYDKDGWHAISYLDQGEFYSEFGSYDVSITLPSNYRVLATGNCTNVDENRWLDSLATLPIGDTTADDVEVTSSPSYKTVQFHEDLVHDFAWFADKRWVIRKRSVTSAVTSKNVTIWTAFLPSFASIWAPADSYLAQTLKYYEQWVGGYPYNTLKAVLGDMRAGGGMEYPTITVIDKSARSNFQTVVVHEAGHNWFYGMLGSNERDHPWLDEGLNTFYEKKTLAKTATDSGFASKIGKLNEELLYYELAATHNDLAIDLPAYRFPRLNYGIDVYYKTGIMLRWLEQYMGPADFEKGMKSYFEHWKHKHPSVSDFQKEMQNNSTKSLSWFFDGIIHTENKIDFTLARAKVTNGATAITVKNRSGLLAPVKLQVLNGDSLLYEQWEEPFIGNKRITLPVSQWTKIKIDSLAPDAKSTNDVYRRHALLHKFSLSFKPFVGTNVGEKYKLFFSPALGYNQYDGVAPGLLLHDLTLPENRLRFAFIPQYSFVANSFVGTGSVAEMFYPKSLLQEVLLQGDVKTYHYKQVTMADGNNEWARFFKTAFSINLKLKQADDLTTVSRDVQLKYYYINEESIATDSALLRAYIINSWKSYGTASYTHANTRTYNPFQYRANAQLGADFAKLSIEGNARIDYNVKNKSLFVRGYIGKMLVFNNNASVVDRYKLNASFSGANDYLYDGTYIGRNENDKASGQQVSMQECGFKIPVNSSIYRNDNWLATLNLATDLPLGRLPIRAYLDLGFMPNINPTLANNKSTTFFYNGGLEVVVLRDVVSFYIPVMMSSDFREYLNSTFGRKNAFGHSLSFTIQLQHINWLQSPTRFLKMVVN